ncbi:hypothetical protein AAG906_015416 [Vitis piasezkii]
MAFSSSASSNVIFAPPNIGHPVSIKRVTQTILYGHLRIVRSKSHDLMGFVDGSSVHQNLLMVLLIQHIFSGIRKISQTSLPLNPEPVYTT